MTNHNPTNIAALDCSLQSGYLIEASAGTGKTWTLTGIILRLLIEKKYPPERIVATTFTRAAAAEMQERISQRLQDFYALIRWLKSMQPHYPNWFDASQFADNLPQITKLAADANVDAQDPIHIHLLGLLIGDAAALDEAIYRTSLFLTTLDKLFVGTLDSLTQKWLKEFSSQIGHQSDTQITHDEKSQILSIVHDWLRGEEVRLQHQNPTLYQLISQQYDFFGNVELAVDQIHNALQFYSAEIDFLPPPTTDWQTMEMQLDGIGRMDFSGLSPFCLADYGKAIGMHAAKLKKLADFVSWQSLIDLIQQYGMAWLNHLTDEQQNLLDFVNKNPDGESFFNKKHDADAKETFLAVWQNVEQVARWQLDMYAYVEHYLSVCCCQMASVVRQKIAPLLESQKRTTFTLQMVRLLAALQNNPSLARHIRHHYPVALIDESQDVNGLQVQLLELVYLKDMLNYQLNLKQYHEIGGDKPVMPKGFVLLVGDPKQAIYRFRGGDVANYNLLKHYGERECGRPILDRSLVLTVNRRSNRALIESLNAWFGDNQQANFGNHAYLGTGIFYQSISAFRDEQRLSWQTNQTQDEQLGKQSVAVLHFDYDNKNYVYQRLAEHINLILQSGHTLGGKKIRPEDIAILSRRKDKLAQVKTALNALGIPAVSASEENVFCTDAGKDLYALIAAIVNPNHTASLGRWLTSWIMGYDLNEAMRLLNDEQDESMGDFLADLPAALPAKNASFSKLDLLTYLKKLSEKWQNFGLATALNDAFLQSPDNQENLWLRAARLGERYLADMWQLLELLGTQQDMHERQILAWYEQMMQTDASALGEEQQRQTLPSEIGVNLMTIHKSKGLEFAIVYVLGLSDAPVGVGQTKGFYPYSDENFVRRLSSTKGTTMQPDYFADLDQQEQVAEDRRLGYVALTRASEQLFVVATDAYNKTGLELRPLYQWLENTQKAEFDSDHRLKNVIGWQTLTADAIFDQPYQGQQTQLSPVPYVDWRAVMAKTSFTGVKQTSFTALISRLDSSLQDALAMSADYDELSVISNLAVEQLAVQTANLPAEPSIRQSFMRGANAGDFLHKVLQFAGQVDELGTVIDDKIKQLGLPSKYASQKTQAYLTGQAGDDTLHQQLTAWLGDVLTVPFLASKVSLAQLDKTVQARELGFVLGMKPSFSIKKLNQIFEQYSDKSLALLDDQAACYRYLRGEIDLVYEHQGKFYVVDYKSNHLGDQLTDYQTPNLERAMDKAGYWLQAAIYQVALHRLLSIKLPDYQGNEQRYLGAVEYVFLRGVSHDDDTLGHLLWQPPFELIVALDQVL